jgi:methyltransferase-like protein/SAM-dependent methyltransferase
MNPQSFNNTYDLLPYPSHPFAQTHPDRLATVATLFGLQPAAPDRCRVLELGCASGGNLIPMALALPESTFVGIDLSGAQAAHGSRMAAELGLNNLQIRQASILDVDESYGSFDYILCHGVYSWVPPPVRDKILAICRERLAEHGVAFVSYNTYPGWHLRGVVRDMLRYHAGRRLDNGPAERTAQARKLLDFLAASCRQEQGAYGQLLRKELELLAGHSDSYFFHEHLEENNEPLYFHQFHDLLEAKQLRYLAEADVSDMVPSSFSPEVQNILDTLAPSLLQMEQYLDFLRNRTFRQSLICHGHHKPKYKLRPEVAAAFHIASQLKTRGGDVNLDSDAPLVFEGPNEISLTAPHPILKAAFLCLEESWPAPIPFAELQRRARRRLKTTEPINAEMERQDAWLLGQAILTAYTGASNRLVELSLCPPRFVPRVSAQPEASRLARHQASGSVHVTNLRHQPVKLSEFDRQLLPALDGRRDRAALLENLLDRVAAGRLTMTQSGMPIRTSAAARPLLAQTLDRQLPRLAAAALLVA